jgi:hypothetical protein
MVPGAWPAGEVQADFVSKCDPYCRLRVPKYQKIFETVFFISLLILYYFNLVEESPHVTVAEVLLYVWLVSFAYEEWAKLDHAGKLFYTADFWSVVDLGIIVVGFAYFVTRESSVPAAAGWRAQRGGWSTDC